MGPLFVFVFWLFALTATGLLGVIFSYPFLGKNKKKKMLLTFVTPMIVLCLMVISLKTCILLFQHFNIDLLAEECETTYYIVAFICFSFTTIIASLLWKKVLSQYHEEKA